MSDDELDFTSYDPKYIQKFFSGSILHFCTSPVIVIKNGFEIVERVLNHFFLLSFTYLLSSMQLKYFAP
jgi:hypothetical protein